MAPAADGPCVSAARTRGALLAAAIDVIERHFDDSELDPTIIAAHIGVSRRYLHLLFSSRPATVMRCVVQRRLDEAVARLSSGRNEVQSVTTLALDCGFSSATCFARLFKREYGVTPTQFRRGERQSGRSRDHLASTSSSQGKRSASIHRE